MWGRSVKRLFTSSFVQKRNISLSRTIVGSPVYCDTSASTLISATPLEIPDYGFADCPDGSHLHVILDKCRQAVSDSGANPTELYIPSNFIKDSVQSAMAAWNDLGFTWSTSIVLTVIGFRLLTLPIAIKAQRQGAIITVHKPNLEVLRGDLNAAKGPARQIVSEKYSNYVNANKIPQLPWAQFAFAGVQAGLFYNIYSHFKGMAAHPDQFRSFVTESPLWLDSLALPDPIYGLPLLTASAIGASTYLSVAIKGNGGFMDGVSSDKIFFYVACGGAFFMVSFMGGTAPAALWLVMLPNFLFSTSVNLLLKQPTIRSLLDIPDIKDIRRDMELNASVSGSSGTGSARVHYKTLVADLNENKKLQDSISSLKSENHNENIPTSADGVMRNTVTNGLTADCILDEQRKLIMQKALAARAAQSDRAAKIISTLRCKQQKNEK